MKYLKGSLTVEASILVPIIIFIITAQLYMIFFLHDSVILQSNSCRTAEGMLWDRNDSMEAPLYKMGIGNTSIKKKEMVTEVLDIIGCRESVDVQMDGTLVNNAGQLVPFVGNAMTKKTDSNMIRISYTEDRIRSIMIKKIKQ